MSSQNSEYTSIIEITSESTDPSISFTPTKSQQNEDSAKRRYLHSYLGPISIDLKIDEIQHNQQQTLNLQKEIYYEQKLQQRRLSLLEKWAMKMCGNSPPKENVHIRSPVRQNVSPNTWERRNDSPVHSINLSPFNNPEETNNFTTGQPSDSKY